MYISRLMYYIGEGGQYDMVRNYMGYVPLQSLQEQPAAVTLVPSHCKTLNDLV